MRDFSMKRREREPRTPADLRRVLSGIYPPETVDDLMQQLGMEDEDEENEEDYD